MPQYRIPSRDLESSVLHIPNNTRQAVDKVLNPTVLARSCFNSRLRQLVIGGGSIFSIKIIIWVSLPWRDRESPSWYSSGDLHEPHSMFRISAATASRTDHGGPPKKGGVRMRVSRTPDIRRNCTPSGRSANAGITISPSIGGHIDLGQCSTQMKIAAIVQITRTTPRQFA